MLATSDRIDLLAHCKRGVEFWLSSPDFIVYRDDVDGWHYVGSLDHFMDHLGLYAGSFKLVPTELLKEIIREESGNPDKFISFPLAYSGSARHAYVLGRITSYGSERRDVERAWKEEKTAQRSPVGSDEKAPLANRGAEEQPDLFVLLRSHRQHYFKG